MMLKKVISNFCNRSRISHLITCIDCSVFINHAAFLSQQNLVIFSNAISAKKEGYMPRCLTRKIMKNEPLKTFNISKPYRQTDRS